jgi:hypothetical protein
LEVFGLRSLDELPRVEGLQPQAVASRNHQHPEEHDVTVTYPSADPQQEIETVRTQDLPQDRFAGRGNGAASVLPVVAQEDEEFEEEELEEKDDELEEDDDELDEEFDDEDLEEEEWEYEDEEDGEFEDLEEDEWEEVEEDDDEEDEEWEDDEDEDDEDWEDD